MMRSSLSAVPLRVARLAGNAFRFTWQDLGAGFQYNLYTGSLGTFYSHGSSPLSCSGLGAGITCNGTTCTLDQPGASLPAGNRYFLVTGTGFGREGTSGVRTGGIERDPSQNTCSP